MTKKELKYRTIFKCKRCGAKIRKTKTVKKENFESFFDKLLRPERVDTHECQTDCYGVLKLIGYDRVK